MLRTTIIALAFWLAALPGVAQQGFGCPTNVNQRIYELTEQASAREITPAEAAQAATDIAKGCARDRVMLGQFLEMFTRAGLAYEPPDPNRFGSHLNAFRTINGIERVGGGSFEPITLTAADGTEFEWSVIDERNAYWDLMFAMSSDFLVFGVHADIYTPGKTERIGCGLYPAEEASALARHAVGNVDGGELLPRVSFLGRECDTPERETSGYVAQYFAAHHEARADNPDYIGLTGSDIRSGLRYFLEKHLDGAAESDLFPAADVTEFMNF